MSKMLPATCVGGVVTAEGVPVPAAEILSEGVGESEGVVFLDEDKARYIAKISPDLKTTLEHLIEALGKAIEALNNASAALTSIDTAGYIIAVSGGSGAPAVGTPSPPVATGDISALDTATQGIEAAKAELETLKGMLR